MSHLSTPSASLRHPFRAVGLTALGVLSLLAAARAATDDERLSPAVAAFREALRQDRNLSRDDVAGLRFREENLTKKAKDLRSLTDLARALLLLDWGTESINEKVAALDSRIREQLMERFEAGVKVVVKSGTAAQKVAVATLLTETVSDLRKQGSNLDVFSFDLGPGRLDTGKVDELRRTRRLKTRFLRIRFAALAPEMAQLTRDTNATEARRAGALALGQIQPDPAVSVPALDALLSSGNAQLRLAAATALNQSVQIADDERRKSLGLDIEPFKEPDEPFRPIHQVMGLVRGEPIRTASRVLPVVSRGLSDDDDGVRRQCILAWQHTTGAIADMIYPPVDPDKLPPRDRVLSRADTRTLQYIREEREVALGWRKELQPILTVIKNNLGALARATRDPDSTVRDIARNAVEDLGKTQQRLLALERSIPDYKIDETEPEKEGDKKDEKKDDKKNDRKPDRKDVRRPRRESDLRLVRFQAEPKEKPAPPPEGPLTQSLRELLPVIVRGLSDPRREGRLAAVAAIEAMGAQGADALPALVSRGLCDEYLFVRWASARTIGELAPRGADLAVPNLAKALFDRDLDYRLAVAAALRRYGAAAKAALPALERMVDRGDTEGRVAVLNTISAVGVDAGPALPAVARALNDEDPRVRGTAADVLGNYGPGAVRYVPDLMDRLNKALNDPDADVRRSASDAVLRISGR